MTDDELERMLRGAAAGPGVPARLERIIGAGRAPGHPGELAGEEPAVAAFRAASRTRATPATSSRPAPVRRFVVRMAAVKIAAAVGVLAAGGLAIAAATGTIDPRALLGANPESSVPARPTSGSGTAGTPAAGPSSTPAGTPRPATAAPGGGLTAAAAAALCRDFLALPPGQAKKLLQDPPYDALTTRAGGGDEVAEHCAALLGTASGPPEPDQGKPSRSPRARPQPPHTPAQPDDQGQAQGRDAGPAHRTTARR
jgi:hypothetical protein